MVLAWMGFLMLRGVSSPTTDGNGAHADVSLTPLILFTASPGTITGVITLSIAHARHRTEKGDRFIFCAVCRAPVFPPGGQSLSQFQR